MKEKYYNKENACKYAEKWAYLRNPQYYDFDKIGGDCTNFISQCIYSGSNIMNYEKENGWYYINGNNKSPSWTGVEFLYNFITQNKSIGPFGIKVEKSEIEIGDIAQISFDGKNFQHSVIIVKVEDKMNLNGIYIASHTYDSFNKKISEYKFEKIRFIHIKGVRIK